MIKKLIPPTVKQQLKVLLKSGNKYICPFCNYKAKSLFPIGLDIKVLKEKEVIGAGRRNGGCYKCGSNDRERLIYVFLKEKLDLFKQDTNFKILHLAPEKNLSKAILEGGYLNYVCGDLFTEGYIYPDHVKNMNVLNLPFEDDYFDLIICNHLLEHVPEDLEAMKELYRVLKKNGKAILQVPISKNSEKTFEDFSVVDPEQREIIFGQFDHVRIYGQDYPDRLSSVGFFVERINISKDFPKSGLVDDEDIFVGIKKA